MPVIVLLLGVTLGAWLSGAMQEEKNLNQDKIEFCFSKSLNLPLEKLSYPCKLILDKEFSKYK